MKKFALKSILFCGLIAVLCAIVIGLSTTDPFRSYTARLTDSEDFMDDSGMLPYFEQARTSGSATTLILGDSICRQLFNALENEDTDALATNAALMISGQYLLAREYLDNHPDTTDIYLIMHPLAITRTFDMEWGYRYGAMTYVETDTLQYLDIETREILTDTYGSLLLQPAMVQLVEDSPIVRKIVLSSLLANRDPYVQSNSFEIADRCVKSLYDLCAERNVELHLLASPSTEYYRDQIEALKTEYQATWLSSVYPDYLESIYYYPDEWSEDLSHFSGEYAEREALNAVIREAYGNSGLPEITLAD